MVIKKIVLSLAAASAALTISAVATAAGNSFFDGAGFVIGGQAGYADNHWNTLHSSDVSGTSDGNDKGFAARGYVGFDFNKYLGVESGFTYLPTTKYDAVFASDAGFQIKGYAVDLLAKFSLPITDSFSLYGKAGGVYVTYSYEPTGSSFGPTLTTFNTGPAFGLGASYEVVQNLKIDASWMRFTSQSYQFGEIPFNYQPSPDIFLLGLSYKFPIG
jgi:opacity protein-like surface antigen